jgi:phosphoenolpyruvate carboxykinase (ATP)
VLSPRQTWNNDEKYYKKAYMLSGAFIKNFKKYEDQADSQILAGAPNMK